MNDVPRSAVMLVGCAAALVVGGCAAAPGAASTVSPSGGTEAAAAGTPALLTEVQRELAAMRTTHYQHHTAVDEAKGIFDYDCSGLVDYALGRADPAALHALPTSTSSRPLAADIERRLSAAGQDGDPWQAVASVARLQPGDVIAWLATDYSTTADTGHTMIVMGEPRPNARRSGEWLVPVADSTISPHADDSRERPATGLGTGVIGLLTDAAGRPTAFYWRGAESDRAIPTEVALGRPA